MFGTMGRAGKGSPDCLESAHHLLIAVKGGTHTHETTSLPVRVCTHESPRWWGSLPEALEERESWAGSDVLSWALEND